MNKIKRFLLLLSAVPLSSCSLIFGGTPTYMIENVESQVDENGVTTVTISFMNDAREDLVITLPQGGPGADTTTIASIDAVLEGDNILITIHYVDEEREDAVLSVPVTNGEAGKEITEILSHTDTSGATVLQFVFSDGSVSSEFTIPNGIDGENSQRLVTAYQVTDDTNGFILNITLSDGTSFDVPISNGEPGTTITQVEWISYNILRFYLSNGEYIDVDNLPINAPQEWITGIGSPSSSVGDNSDYYVDIWSGGLYYKENGSWRYLIAIEGLAQGDTRVYYEITFDPNGGSFQTRGDNPITFIVEGDNRLSYSVLESVLGTPTSLNGEFIGFYTSQSYSPYSGKFDSSIKVTSDMTFYAWYK